MEFCPKKIHLLDENNLYIKPSGRRICRACRREQDRLYRQKHPEKCVQKNIYKKKWSLRNKGKNQEYCKKYQQNNLEKYKRSRQKYLKNHPEIRRAWEHRKRVRKANQLGDWHPDYEQILYKEQQGLCYYCDKDLVGIYHIEHMVPLSRGGMHDKDNIVLSCPSCNLEKGTKTAEEFLS